MSWGRGNFEEFTLRVLSWLSLNNSVTGQDIVFVPFHGVSEGGQPGGRAGVSRVLRAAVGRGEDSELRTCVLSRLSGQNAGEHQQRWEHQRHYRLPHLQTPHVHQEAEGSAGEPRGGGQGAAPGADAGGAAAAAAGTAPGRTARLWGQLTGGRSLDVSLLQRDLRATPSPEVDPAEPQRVSDLHHKRWGATHGWGGRAQRGDDGGPAAAQEKAREDLHHSAVPAALTVSLHHPGAGGCDSALDSVGIEQWCDREVPKTRTNPDTKRVKQFIWILDQTYLVHFCEQSMHLTCDPHVVVFKGAVWRFIGMLMCFMCIAKQQCRVKLRLEKLWQQKSFVLHSSLWRARPVFKEANMQGNDFFKKPVDQTSADVFKFCIFFLQRRKKKNAINTFNPTLIPLFVKQLSSLLWRRCFQATLCAKPLNLQSNDFTTSGFICVCLHYVYVLEKK